MSGEATVTLREHLSALREADLRFDAERDRRLTEVAVERERALLIKETADKTALDLARQINDLHLAALNGEQSRLASDRERFLSRDSYDTAQKDFAAWRDQVNSNLNLGAGRDHGVSLAWTVAGSAVLLVLAILGFVISRGGP